jgi:hypothetical protein
MQRLFARRLRVCTISPSAREASLCTRVFFAPCRRLREALESSAELACTYPFTLTMYTTRPGRAHTTGVDAPDDIPPPFRSTVYRPDLARYIGICRYPMKSSFGRSGYSHPSYVSSGSRAAVRCAACDAHAGPWFVVVERRAASAPSPARTVTQTETLTLAAASRFACRSFRE